MSDPNPKFYFNGRAYNSLEEMPEEVRRYLKDENQNGMPDFVENIFGGNLAQLMKNNPTLQKFVFKDKIFDKLDQLPPEEQQKVREKFEKLNTFFSSGGSSAQPGASISTDLPFSSPPSGSSSVPSLGGSYSPVRSGPSKVFLSLVTVVGILIFAFVVALWLLLK